MSETNWTQFKLIITEPTRYNGHFDLIKNEIIPFITNNSIPFWVTNYWNQNEDYILFRVNLNENQLDGVTAFLDNLIERDLIVRYETSNWDIRGDAEARINGLSRFSGFNPNTTRIERFNNNQIFSIPDTNIDEREDQLLSLFESLGECTKAIYSRLSSRPEDKWIMSVFIHLLLNSLTYSGPTGDCEENRIRQIPPF